MGKRKQINNSRAKNVSQPMNIGINNANGEETAVTLICWLMDLYVVDLLDNPKHNYLTKRM